MNTSDSTPIVSVAAHRLNQNSLFELVGISNKLVLDGVYLNGLHALRRFEVRNISTSPIVVKLRSNLGEQVAFQLTNENLPDRDFATTPAKRKPVSLPSSLFIESEGDIRLPQEIKTDDSTALDTSSSGVPSVYNTPSEAGTPPEPTETTGSHQITTNTAEAAGIGVFGAESNTLHGHQFNQLFNYVNHIDEVRIEPGQSQKVILAFLPDVHGRGRKGGKKEGDGAGREEGPDGGAFIPLNADEECYDFVEINGQLFFFAYKAGAKSVVADTSSIDTTGKETAPDQTGALKTLAPGDDINVGCWRQLGWQVHAHEHVPFL